MLKAHNYYSLNDHLNRQSRGFAGASAFVTFLLVALIIKQICDFINAKEADERRVAQSRPPRQPPFPKRREREFDNDYTGTPVGAHPTSRSHSNASVSDARRKPAPLIPRQSGPVEA